MAENRPIQKVLEELIATKDFEKLDEFSGFSTSLSQEEKELLSKLYVLQAEDFLKRDLEPHLIEVAKKSLQKACELNPQNLRAWYQRGLAFAKGESEELLHEALSCFEAALRLDEAFFDGWYASANVFFRLGMLKDDESMIYQAEAQFEKAESFLEKERAGEFYWHRGLVKYALAKRSGEPSEFYQAIQLYTKAFEFGLLKESFYNDFANALVECASLINREEWILEAIELYLSSLKSSSEKTCSEEEAKEIAVRHFNLAGCYYYLFRLHLEEKYFVLAHENFQSACRLYPQFFQAYFHRARLLLFASKLTQDANQVRAACGLFEKALKLSSSQPLLYAYYSEALATIGAHEENMTHLQTALLVIEKGLDLDPENVDIKASKAYLYYQLGRYFGEEEYYKKALIILDECLQIEPRGTLWYSQAMCLLAIGEISSDLRTLHDALSAFSKASHCEMGRFGYFWNDWGLVLVTIAETTRDKKYLLEAEEKFERAILLHDTVEPDWLFNYGCTLDFLGDFTDEESYYERAIQAFTAALAIHPNYPNTELHLACALANLAELTGELEFFYKSFDAFQHVVEGDPEDDLAFNEWGVALLHFIELTADLDSNLLTENTTYLELAEQNFLQAISLGNLFALYNLACLYSLRGNISDAIFYFEKAVACETHPSLTDLVRDEWLLNLRNTQYFHDFLKKSRE